MTNELRESLYHLFLFRNEFANLLASMKRFSESDFYRSNPEDYEIIVAACLQLISIKIVSCDDELSKCRNQLKAIGYESLIEGLKTVKKVIDNRWPHISKFRNNIAAHSYRVKGVSVFTNRKFGHYKIPKTQNDFVVIASTLAAICEAILNEFPETFEGFKSNSIAEDFYGD